MSRRSTYALLAVVFFGILTGISCQKENPPDNPYDLIERPDTSSLVEEPAANSIVGLHRTIFFPKCANPGCHDGTFEPDFRTIESTFSTLVYQPVNKLTLDSNRFFTYRVIPGRSVDSWLMERLETPTTEYMPSNSTRLSAQDIDHVRQWIDAGCPDYNGQLPQRPDLLPNIAGYVATDPVFNRIDTARRDGIVFNPFLVNSGSSMNIFFVALDTADGDQAVDPSAFTVKEIRFSTNKNDFTNATVIPASLYVPNYQSWMVTVPNISWPIGTTVYFRIYVNDGRHASSAEFPRLESLDYYKTYYAFEVH